MSNESNTEPTPSSKKVDENFTQSEGVKILGREENKRFFEYSKDENNEISSTSLELFSNKSKQPKEEEEDDENIVINKNIKCTLKYFQNELNKSNNKTKTKEESTNPNFVNLPNSDKKLVYWNTTTIQELKIIHRILTNEKIIFIDVEGRLGRTEQATFIQISGNSGNLIFLINIPFFQKNKNQKKLEMIPYFLYFLKDICVTKNKIKKVFYDVRTDSECLYYQFGIKMKNSIIDLQVLNQGIDISSGRYESTGILKVCSKKDKNKTVIHNGRYLLSLARIVDKYCSKNGSEFEFQSMKKWKSEWNENERIIQSKEAKEYSVLDIFYIKNLYVEMMKKFEEYKISTKIKKRIDCECKRRLKDFRDVNDFERKKMNRYYQTFEMKI